MIKKNGSVLVLASHATAEAVREAAQAEGLDIETVPKLSELLGRLGSARFAATFVSLDADGMDGAVAQRIGDAPASGALLLGTSRVSLEVAVLAEACGAVALLREPLDGDDVRRRLQGVLDEGRVVPVPEAGEASTAPSFIGESAPMGTVFETVARAARSTTTLLVTGESGTGKEEVARAVHWASDRSDGPFVAVNCAAIPEHLLESELFGHERGAFTGAVARRVGRFERAHGGTLFLDEIGDMSLVLQAKVLRVLEERVIERVGGEEAKAVDVRVVAATHQDLRRAMKEGRFREDLYFRLAVVEISLPPLRERGADLRLLALHFASHFARRHAHPLTGITEQALRRLESAPWPGNVRELRNVIDRAVLLASGPVIKSSDLRLGAGAPTASPASDAAAPGGYAPTLTLQEVEAEHIARVLAAEAGHMGRAAEVLGIHRNTLTRKMQAYGLEGGR